MLGRLARVLAPKVAMALATVWLLSTAVFFALRLLPGDPAALVLGDLADEASRVALRRTLHLDEPIFTQYARFLFGLVTLDLGASLRSPTTPAFARVLTALPATAALAATATALGGVFGVSAAVLSVGPFLGAARRWVHGAVLAIAATPLLAFAPLATYVLAVRWRIVPLPGDPSAGLAGLLFASTLLGLPLGAQVARVGRAALLELRRAMFLTVARGKGASPARIFLIHALPAASAPLFAVLGTQLGALLGGAVVLERLFERPGLGTLLLEAYGSRDLPVLEACIVASSALFVGAQMITTALHAFVDPRAGSGS